MYVMAQLLHLLKGVTKYKFLSRVLFFKLALIRSKIDIVLVKFIQFV